MNVRGFLIAAASLCAPLGALHAETVASPDGRIVVTVDADSEGIPFYQIALGGKPLIAKSTIAFNFTDEDPLRRGLEVESKALSPAVDTTWEQPWGERRFVRDRHNELAVTFLHRATSRRFTTRFRVFDDGVGFRSEFPDRPDHPQTSIAEELTEFDIAPKGTAWWIQAGDFNRYEQIYQQTPIDAISMAHTPMTLRLEDGTHLSFHEAALVDYSGMWLQRLTGQRFRAHLSPSSRGAKVVRKGAFTTPWRSIRIAGNAAGLVESDLELNLNEPNKLGDVRWFKPAKYIGIWWGMISGKWSWAQGPQHGA
ncbi:MAG: glycoside hydrolase family 97 N-terminal domain-containing protein, partial [Tsuneonella sp.]